MILETVLNLWQKLLFTIHGILPDIPNLEHLTDSVDSVFEIIFSNLQLLGCFVRPSTILVIVPVFLVVYNFDYIYKLVMWILKKIPFVGIE